MTVYFDETGYAKSTEKTKSGKTIICQKVDGFYHLYYGKSHIDCKLCLELINILLEMNGYETKFEDEYASDGEIKTTTEYRYEAWNLGKEIKLNETAKTLEEIREIIDKYNRKNAEYKFPQQKEMIIKVQYTKEMNGDQFVKSTTIEEFVEIYPN